MHPTKLTNENGEALAEIDSSGVGTIFDKTAAPPAYLFDEVYYDGKSGLERSNIVDALKIVTVYAKIPKNSIRIPLVGGGSYSPDFAYLIEKNNGSQTLNLVVEAKDKDKLDLSDNEKQKIEHAKQLFNSFGTSDQVKFETQLKGDTILDVIERAMAP